MDWYMDCESCGAQVVANLVIRDQKVNPFGTVTETTYDGNYTCPNCGHVHKFRLDINGQL